MGWQFCRPSPDVEQCGIENESFSHSVCGDRCGQDITLDKGLNSRAGCLRAIHLSPSENATSCINKLIDHALLVAAERTVGIFCIVALCTENCVPGETLVDATRH